MGSQGLGRHRGKMMLERIDDLGKDGGRIIYRAGDQKFRHTPDSITAESITRGRPVPERCTMHFLTRLDAVKISRYPNVRFGVIFRTLQQRIIDLAGVCEIDCATDIDRGRLYPAADLVKTMDGSRLHIEIAERYSSRQQRMLPFSGRLGSLSFEGNLEPFWPYLLLGEVVHIGKKTTFGVGRYELIAPITPVPAPKGDERD